MQKASKRKAAGYCRVSSTRQAEQGLSLGEQERAVRVWPLAALSLEAHLVKLEREGLVGKRGARWVAVSG